MDDVGPKSPKFPRQPEPRSYTPSIGDLGCDYRDPQIVEVVDKRTTG
jgi:hypothetical protein